jgi:hypothetical protein
MRIAWDLYGSTLASDLGFMNPAQQQFMQKGVCIHKLLEAHEVMYETLTDEMRRQYLRDMRLPNVPSVEGFYAWICDSEGDETFSTYAWFLTQLYPAFLLLLKGLRDTDKKAGHEAYDVARVFFTTLFFLFGNNFYGPGTIEDRTTWLYSPCDKRITDYFKTIFSLGCQGAELQMEEAIKRMKGNLTSETNMGFQVGYFTERTHILTVVNALYARTYCS